MCNDLCSFYSFVIIRLSKRNVDGMFTGKIYFR